jgi:tRNA (adenine22-N1)-methyltransferase
MPIKLENKRLLTCAELLATSACENRTAADIGTDHGYLACYLVETGICQRAVAADINPLPLKSAERTVRQCALSDKITLVLSDGLDSVSPDGITDIICAGMGGELIIRILSRHEWIKKCTLVLQPMTKADELRRWLYDGGFFVEEERACRDGKFVYTIMRVSYNPSAVDYLCDERYLSVGRIKPDGKDSADYIRITAERIRRAGIGMLQSGDKRSEGENAVRLADGLLKELGE